MTDFEISKGYKFGALAIHRAGRKRDLPLEIDLGDELWIVVERPLDIADHWRKWLGSIRCEKIEDANLWSVSTMRSGNLEVLDDENSLLSSRVEHYFLSLLLVGRVIYESAYFMTGSNIEGKAEIRQFGDLGNYFPSYGASDFIVGPDELTLAARVLRGLQPLYSDNDLFRVRRGIRVFWRGLQERNPEDRLHQFVRSLDAIVMSGDADEFGKRAQVFAQGDGIQTVLKDSYTLRSMSEHLHGWEPVIERLFSAPGAPKHNEPEAPPTDENVFRRVRQLEDLARHIYGQIVLSLELQKLFRDKAIRQFWKLPEDERQKLWPNPLNIDAIR